MRPKTPPTPTPSPPTPTPTATPAPTTTTTTETQNEYIYIYRCHQPGEGGLGLGALCWAMLRKKLDKRIELRRSDWTGRRLRFGELGCGCGIYRISGLECVIVYVGLCGVWGMQGLGLSFFWSSGYRVKCLRPSHFCVSEFWALRVNDTHL